MHRLGLRGVAASMMFVMAACTVGPQAPGPAAALPDIVAHRGGTADAPENSLAAIKLALAHHSDAIWLSVQLSRDGVPVLYRPADLSALTDAHGPVAGKTAAELATIDTGAHFRATQPAAAAEQWMRPVGIPTLEQALAAIPAEVPVILDMKALPAAPQARAVARVLDAHDDWSRVTIYSTDASYQKAFRAYPRARLFESRDATRHRIFGVLLSRSCDAPEAGTRAGFELGRDVELVEHFTLGEGRSSFFAQTWTPASVQCFRRTPDTRLMAFAVNDAASYRHAACLHIDAVLVDSPARMARVRRSLRLPLDCTSLREPAATR
ncbi:glycerophosphodiester phosphodiesterase [Burkholderia multivorans]|uniref:glycerophosphodiester phosphodiesterase family protein n=1 Tax=Burkholderia multivorans TaxID=87883 RepID=UPI001C22732D|nr:glycerophosphodiester phosphodiesterase [Burkholderia multivorans]